MGNEFLVLVIFATLVQYGKSYNFDSYSNKSTLIKNRYIAVLKKNCTEEDIHYVVGTVRGSVKNGLSDVGSVQNFSTLVYLTSGIVGFVFDGDPASVDKVR